MSRPLTRDQALENTAFLRHLRRTGNVRESARAVGVSYGTIQHRRKRHADFAQRWDAALTTAQARLLAGGGRTAPARQAPGDPHRTEGGEPVVVRVRQGRLQIRRAHPGKLTKACEQAFLAALSATANITLSAAAAGASFAAFDRRRRRNPAFAREMRLALQTGYERVEAALLASWHPGSHEDEAWRTNDPPPVPAMTANQALQLLYLHQKEARLTAAPGWWRRRGGEPAEVHAARLRDRYLAELALEAEEGRLATVMRNAGMLAKDEPAAPVLPALDQVTGWSRADPGAVPVDDARALFGGWRVEDMRAGGGRGKGKR
jgi:hypothetical protein